MMNLFKQTKNLTNISKLIRQPVFGFGGGHHDIDRTSIRMRDDATGKSHIIKGITWIPTKLQEG